MLLAEAWARYRRSWQTLVAANLFTNILTSGLFLWMAGGTLAQLAANPGALPTMDQLQTAARLMLPWSIGIILVSTFVQGGVYGTVASVWHVPDTPWTAFWAEGWHNWWRMVKVTVLLGFGLMLPATILLGILCAVVVMLSQFLSLPGSLSGLILVLLGVFGLLPVFAAASYYGTYASVADGAGGRHAVGEGWRCLAEGYADCLTTALMVIVVAAIIAVVALPVAFLLVAAHVPPVVSHLLSVILQSLITPTFLILYIAVRYETNQRR